MQLSLFKKDDKIYLQIPDELAGSLSNCKELEIFPLKDGFYLLTSGMIAGTSAPSVPNGTKKEEKEQKKETTENTPHSVTQSTSPQSASSVSLTPAERKVLHGLLTIQFKDRTPEHVKETFNPNELAVLKELEKKKYVTVFYGTKYKDTGVYNIDNEVYPLLKGESAQPTPATYLSASTNQKPAAGNLHPGANSQQPEPGNQKPVASSQQPVPQLPAILKIGYAVFQNQGEAQEISDEIRKLPKGEVIGIKGFDGKYYAVTKEYLTEATYNLKNNLKGDMNVAAITKACNADETGCRAVLYILAERGDVIEKKRDTFTLV